MKYWYTLNDYDIKTVADQLDVNLNRAQIKQIKEAAPDYLDWFGAIEQAINDGLQKSKAKNTKRKHADTDV